LQNLFKQIIHFFIYSGIGWIIDMFIYTVLTKLGLNLVIANIISALIAATYVYFISTRKLFVNNSKISLKLKYIIFIIYQIILIVTSSYLILFIANLLSNINLINNINILINNIEIIAKVINTPITMTINFIVMKSLIEKL